MNELNSQAEDLLKKHFPPTNRIFKDFWRYYQQRAIAAISEALSVNSGWVKAKIDLELKKVESLGRYSHTMYSKAKTDTLNLVLQWLDESAPPALESPSNAQEQPKEDDLKIAMEECERLAGLVEYWQEKYYELNPPRQPVRHDFFTNLSLRWFATYGTPFTFTRFRSKYIPCRHSWLSC